MVEGDAENILIPVIADILGYPLEKYGISIVNVGSTAFLRYSKIMVRADNSTIGIPVSVVTDSDVRPYDIDPDSKRGYLTKKSKNRRQKRKNEITSIQMVPFMVLPHHGGHWSIALL